MKDFLGKRILVITAHPDDEGYVSAGTIYKNYQNGGETHLVCATYGEKGTSHLKKTISAKTLKTVRKKELLRAAAILHIQKVKILGFPDGQLKNHEQDFFDKLLPKVKKINPEVILSFGPDGISGHYDHIIAGKVAKKAAKKFDIPFIAASLPPKITKEALHFLHTRRKAGHYKNSIKYRKPNVRILIDSRIKKKALRAHKSQMDNQNAFTGFPKFAVTELLKSEFFVHN